MTETTRRDAECGTEASREPSFLVGLIGSGVGPSLTPSMHEREAQEQGRRLIYRPIDISALGLEPASAVDLVHAARRLGFNGLNITHPCKQLVVSALDELSPDAEALEAVNTVVFHGDRAVGHNTDWSGFAEALRRGLPDAPRGRVVLLGAGGAGSAVAHALMVSGVRELVVADVAGDRAAALAARTQRRFPDAVCVPGNPADLRDLLANADGLVHATPTGMADHPGLPVPEELLRPPLWVADIVYRPVDTQLLRCARSNGCETLDGGGMAVFQASHAFGLITGLRPDAERMLTHFTELTARE
ncbi:shikimate dehydrogenase [Spiractinospora alimapuensis]|uniref:shikimate dehydrogenase n=1 Tax=Spiractinospora alimapuensis TaxID=2820884 RepID=UPI001EEAF29E|nr:shikimate dehydrogenase [Spiractinospora alimapuensis]QVQ52364.1 shikimate dehydrogenase [Spiractinospora alimapuensis]